MSLKLSLTLRPLSALPVAIRGEATRDVTEQSANSSNLNADEHSLLHNPQRKQLALV